MQISFDPLNFEYFDTLPEQACRDAIKERNAKMKEMKKAGYKNVRGWRLTGQLRKYASFGVEDGRVRTVYYISYEEAE